MARSSNRRDLFIQVSGNVDPLKASMKAGQSVLAEFGTAAVNVQAEVERAFKNLGAGAPAQARALEQSYARTFETIRANAQAALSAPTGAGAVEIINAGAARQAAEAAETKAAALRIVADAAQRANVATGAGTEANRVFALAAEAAARGAHEEAAALRAQANVVSGVEAQIESLTGAKKRQIAVTGQARAGMQQLSFQLGDVATQFAAGTPPQVIFAQQIGQVTQAISLMTTKTTGLIGFLGGPWGIALSSAAVLLTPFVAKLFEEGDAALEAAKKLEENSRKTRETEEAKAAFARTVPGVIDAIRAETKELEDQNRSLEENIRLRQGRLRSELNDAQRGQRETTEKLDAARKELATRQRALDYTLSATGQIAAGEAAGPAIAQAQNAVAEQKRKIAELEENLRRLTVSINDAQRGIRIAGFPLAERQAQEAVDKIAAINGQYDRQVEAAKKAAAANDQLAASLGRTLAAVERQRKKDLDAEQARRSAAKKTDRQGPLTDFLRPVDGGGIGGGFGEDRKTHRHQGIDYAVPVGTPVRAPAAGIVDFAGQRGAYGNAIYINFGGGTTGRYAHLSKFNVKPGDRVEAGDIIGLTGGEPGTPGAGRSTGPHLHEEIRINGRPVDPRKRRFRTDAGALEDIEARAGARAESAVNREIAEDIRFGEEERRLRVRLLDLQARTAEHEERRLGLAREEIEVDAKAYAEKIGRLKEAGKLDDAEAARLVALNEEIRGQRERNLKIEEAERKFELQADAQSRSLEYDLQLLRLQLDLATTTAERKRIAGEILKIEQQQRRQALEALRDNPGSSATQVQQARTELGRLPEIEQGERAQQARQNLSPMQEYRERLSRELGDIDDTLERIQVRGLERLEDDLAGAASKALGLKGALGEVVEELIRIGIQQAILAATGGGQGGMGSFFASLFGGGGSSAGAASSAGNWYTGGFADGGRIDGFAGGGRIVGPGTGRSDSIFALAGDELIRVSNGEFIVNAAATAQHLPLLEAVNEGRLRGFAHGGRVGPVAPDSLLRAVSLPPVPRAQSLYRPGTRQGEPVVVHVVAGEMFDARVVQGAAEVVRQAAPGIAEAGAGMARRNLTRPRLR